MRLPVALVYVIVVAALLLALAIPYLTTSYYVAIATQVLYFGLLAMSIDLLGGYLGLMPLGHAGIMGVAAYVMGYLVSKSHWAWPSAVAIALVTTLLVSLVFGLLAVRTTGIFFVMITMAEGMLVWGLAYRWSSVTGAENGIRGVARPDFSTLYWQYYYLALRVFVACAVLLRLVVRSLAGMSRLPNALATAAPSFCAVAGGPPSIGAIDIPALSRTVNNDAGGRSSAKGCGSGWHAASKAPSNSATGPRVVIAARRSPKDRISSTRQTAPGRARRRYPTSVMAARPRP